MRRRSPLKKRIVLGDDDGRLVVRELGRETKDSCRGGERKRSTTCGRVHRKGEVMLLV